MPPTYPGVLSWGCKEPKLDLYTPQMVFQQGKGHVGPLHWHKTHPCQRGLCIVTGPGVLQGPQSYNQTSSLVSKSRERLVHTILSAARSMFAAYASASGDARRATTPRTEIDTFHHFVATSKQLLDAVSQIFIPAFFILYHREFKYRMSIDP